MVYLHPQAASAKLQVECGRVLSFNLEHFEIIGDFGLKGRTAHPCQISGYATTTTDCGKSMKIVWKSINQHVPLTLTDRYLVEKPCY